LGYGRRGDRSPRLRFKTGRAAFTAPASSAPRPWVWAALLAKRLEEVAFAAWTRVVSLPLGLLRRLWASEPVLAPPRSECRPHVSLSEAWPSALASWGILSTVSCGWYRLRSETPSVTSFPPPVGRGPEPHPLRRVSRGQTGGTYVTAQPLSRSFWTPPILRGGGFSLTTVPPCVRGLRLGHLLPASPGRIPG
jgi:hypothetical protein